MKRPSRWTYAAGVIAIAACGTAAGAPQSPSVEPAPALEAAMDAPAADTTPRRHTEADARFVQGMIGHHAQALEMVALVPSRTSRPELRLLAERIEVSQRDEIAIMQRWLTARGEALPDAHAHHGDHPGMPGMATPEEMARLAAASGADFERLFLELMIRHHEGALTMVAALFDTPGAARESETFQLASDVDADQRSEIARMRALLRSGPLPGARQP